VKATDFAQWQKPAETYVKRWASSASIVIVQHVGWRNDESGIKKKSREGSRNCFCWLP